MGHLLSLGEADRKAVVSGGAVEAPTRKVQKHKTICCFVPLINGVLFSEKRKMKDKGSMWGHYLLLFGKK